MTTYPNTNEAYTNHLSFDNTAIAFASKSTQELQLMKRAFVLMQSPWLVRNGTRFINRTLHLKLVRGMVKRSLYKVFCGGETLQDCQRFIEKLYASKVHTMLGYSVESKANDNEYDKTTTEIIRYIKFAAPQDALPFAAFKLSALASVHLLAKIHNGEKLSDTDQYAWHKVKDRVDSICAAGYEYDIKILIDAEESWIQDPIDELAQAMMAQYNQGRVVVYNTYQMYLQRGFTFLKNSLALAKQGNYLLGVKLVRGAYVVKEQQQAEKPGHTNLLNPDKATTDQMFDDAATFCLENIEHLALFAGTHNESSGYHIVRLCRQMNIAPSNPRVFFGQLYGMSDHITYNLAKAGFNAVKYVPYGNVKEVMPYLFRRAQENTAITGQSNRELELIKKELNRRKTEGV
ncbi:proline dehydrogenase family protein [uncultured Microscilla sp.]|uniref:proline dehydrogenase family protein n=1 Tax=uncultured Microscilla sp. TaxID=432653 RepID=UPI0026336D37|nr:proline dehydrogenase family protein [uncultured Microscilla sp.]